jgi:2-methylcitrate dehydratase PrpD
MGPEPASETRTTDVLADFAINLESDALPASSLDAAKRCVLDLVGAAAAGVSSLPARAVRRVFDRYSVSGQATVWFHGLKHPAPAVAMANSAAASALDLDDGHRAAGGHPGAAIIPAALAVGEETRASGRELLAAVVVGYEVAVRVAAARDFAALDTLSTGRWAAYGVVAAAGRLRRLSSHHVAEAMAVAGVQSPGLSAAGYSKVMGNSVKEGIPWATFTGLVALDLAVEGYTGPTDILDHPAYYDAVRIRSKLKESFAIERTYFKPYSCCRWIHSAVDALSDILAEQGLDPDGIRRVRVDTFGRALTLNNYPDPPSLESAQYSVPFCLAVAAVRGRDALLPLKEETLGDAAIVHFARRVELGRDAALDALFPAHTPARVTVETTSGAIFQKTVVDPLGDPDHPLSNEALEEKFHRLTEPVLDRAARESVVQVVHGLDGLPTLDPLMELIANEAPQYREAASNGRPLP